MTQTARKSSSRHAFTLVELMVSIALALLLLVGINQVFKTTTATVGTGYATSQVMREHMAIEKALDRDITRAVPAISAPAIVIQSEQTYAFLDRADLNADRDGNPSTADFTSSGTESALKPGNYNSRSHRIDTLSFFARDINTPYRRQTADQPTSGTDNELIADEQSSEAWIWIGHLRMPDNSASPDPHGYPTGKFFTPGQSIGAPTAIQDAAANPNNYFASDWALGRQAILLKPLPAGDYLQSGTGTLGPLGKDSTATKEYATGKSWQTPYSRFDIANTSIPAFKKVVEAYGPSWYIGLDDYRFNGKPFVTRSTDMVAMAKEMALTTPFLARGCTQFMVEFAGDFITQNADGTINATAPNGGLQPDGMLDFFWIGGYPNGTRQTRWYGFPRDVAGPVSTSNPTGGPDGKIEVGYDVVPVRDVAGASMTFERDVNTTLPQKSNYLGSGGLPVGAKYICAWGPTELAPATGDSIRPWLIRLVLQITDPNGRLNEGQLVEYVYKLPKY